MSAIQPAAIAPPDVSRALEARRFSDPGLVEAATPAEMIVYRCLRSLEETFGVEDPSLVPLAPFRIPGFLVCLHGREYIRSLILASACEERACEAVMELHVPAGTPALWIAGSGDPSTVNGADLICLDNVSIRLTGHRRQHDTTILEIEVIPT